MACVQLNAALESRTISDLDAFDEVLLEVLQSDELRTEMETSRDSMLSYLFQQIGEQGGAEGDAAEQQ